MRFVVFKRQKYFLQKKKKGARRKWEILENKKLLILICQVEELSAAHLR